MDDIISRMDEMLQLMRQNKKMLSVSEAAGYLGVSKQYLYSLTSARSISFYKPGKHIYLSRKELDRYMQQNPVASIQELDQKALTILNKKEIRS